MKLELGDNEYRIVSESGDEGELAPYGAAATAVFGGAQYAAVLDGPGEPSEGFQLLVYRFSPVATVTEEVEFDGDEEDDDEDEDTDEPGEEAA